MLVPLVGRYSAGRAPAQPFFSLRQPPALLFAMIWANIAWRATARISSSCLASGRPFPFGWTQSKIVSGRLISTADCSVTGYLRPHHTAGTRAVSVLCYQWQRNGAWKYIKTVKVKVKDCRSYSKYSGTTTLKGGPWKVKAVHSDAEHWSTETAFSKTIGASM